MAPPARWSSCPCASWGSSLLSWKGHPILFPFFPRVTEGLARLRRCAGAATFSQNLSTHAAVLLRVSYRVEIKEDPHVSPGPAFPLCHMGLSTRLCSTEGLLRGVEPLRAISCPLGWWQPQCVWTPSLRLWQKPGTRVLVSSSERDGLSQTTVALRRSIPLRRVDKLP